MFELLLGYLALKYAPAVIGLVGHTAAAYVRLLNESDPEPPRFGPEPSIVNWSMASSRSEPPPPPAVARSRLTDDMPTGANEFGEVR